MQTVLKLFIMFLFITQAYAQNRTVKGKVLDAGTNTPLPGANVLVAGANQGGTTDANGNFTLSVPVNAVQLVVSYVGYLRKEIPLTNASEYTVSLTAEEGTLGEVVVIGYGSRERKDLTGAISTVSSKDISKSIAQAPELAMQGRMAGVYVSTPGGSPLARPQVRIRGVSTFGNAEPLYVVDGIPLTEYGTGTDNASGSVTRDIRGNVNVLSMINPNDIESISVLKDASAAAIYGVRAANGVVLITTKKGTKGAPKVDVSVSHSIQNVVRKLDMLNVQQFTALYQEAYANNPNEAKNLPDQFNAAKAAYLGNRPTTDWQTPLLNRNAPNTDYSLRISGGNEATRYYVSGGYTNTEGPLINNSLKRYSFATNVDSKISKYISAGLTFRFAYSDANDNTPSSLNYAAETSPWQAIYDPAGPLGYAPSISMKFIPNPELGTPVASRPQYLPSIPPYIIDGNFTPLWGPETNNNIYGVAATNSQTYSLLRNMGTAFLQIEPITGLKLKGTLSADWYYNRRNSWTDIRNYLFLQNPGNPYAVGDGTSKGTYGERHTRNSNLVKEFSINYTSTVGKHSIDLLANAMDQRYVYEFLQGGASQIQFSQSEFRNLANVTPYSNASSFRDLNALQGYLGRVSYNYGSKYYLDATVRRDGASRFAPGYKWGTFPALSIAWRISAEPFMKPLTWIDDLKIRGGWGKLGNQETRSFAYLSLISDAPDYALGSGNGNGIGTLLNGISLPDFPVQNLTWEIGKTSSLGVDGSFFNGRLTATVEYYNRLTSGILQAANLPASVGNQNQPILNIASVRNSGIEVQVAYNGTAGKDFRYSVSGNLTTVKNRVESTFQNLPFGGEGGRIEVGQPIGFLWGYQVGGIFQNQTEIDAWKAKYSDATNNNNFAPGDMYFNDVYGDPTEAGQIRSAKPDGKVSAIDHTRLGSTIPGYYYGINLGAGFKNFDLSVFFQGVGNVYRYNYWRAAGENMSGTGSNQWTTTLGRWTAQNPSTTMPRAVRADPAGNNRFSDRFVESAAFLRLKNIQLGYSLPASVTRSIGFINGLRAYIGATNLFVLTPWTGLDPEDVDRGGTDLIPPVRSFTMGITATF